MKTRSGLRVALFENQASWDGRYSEPVSCRQILVRFQRFKRNCTFVLLCKIVYDGRNDSAGSAVGSPAIYQSKLVFRPESLENLPKLSSLTLLQLEQILLTNPF